MNIEMFYESVNSAVMSYILDDVTIDSNRAFVVSLDDIMHDVNEVAPILSMTRMTVLFEGFYRSLNDSTPLKKQLTVIRLRRWSNHFGTPTIYFLLTYDLHIKGTAAYFGDESYLAVQATRPWQVDEQAHLVCDIRNNVMVDEQSTSKVVMPAADEQAGQFIKTHNPTGGFTTTPCDEYSQKFLEYAGEVSIAGGKVLEIGAAFGAASLQALVQGATVFCNDIDPNNLAVIRNRYLKDTTADIDILTGDSGQLVLLPGSFPDELAGLPANYFDAILICRVLHFFTGDMIDKSLQQLSTFLKPGGKLFVVCETPFLKNWQSFISEYEKRIADGIKWPGEITNPADYESSGRAATLPKFVHWISKDILERLLSKSMLRVEQLTYIDRRGQFPNDLLLDGRESVGAVAVKSC